MKARALLVITLVPLASLAPSSVLAQAPPSGAPSNEATRPSADVAAATELFQQGRAAFDAKDYPTARARLLESARLNPRVGTFISLAECEETLGLLASARAHWEQAANLAAAQGDSRADFARERLTSIDPRVPRLTLRLPTEAPPAVTLREDDVELGLASIGLPMPAEVGKHVIVAIFPGHDPAPTSIELAEGEKREVKLELGPLTPVPPPAPMSAASQGAKRDDRSTLRVVSYAALGLGIVGAGVATYFGVQAINGKNPAGCTGDFCNGPGSDTRNAAIGDGNVSTWLFVGSGALVASGVVLWFVSRPPAATGSAIEWTPEVDARRVGIVVQTRW